MPAIMHAGDAGAKKHCKKNILTVALALFSFFFFYENPKEFFELVHVFSSINFL